MSPPPNVSNGNGPVNNGSESTNGNAAAAANNVSSYAKNLDEWLNNNNNNNNVNPSMYQQKSLDDWLNATMKGSPKTFSVSSTEFLDGPRGAAAPGMSGVMPQAGTSHQYRAPDSTVSSQTLKTCSESLSKTLSLNRMFTRSSMGSSRRHIFRSATPERQK